MSIAFSFRMGTAYSSVGLVDAIIYAVGTLGFSFFPLVLIMQIFPNSESYMLGKSFVGGLVSGLIPRNVDVFGITANLQEWSGLPTKLVSDYYNYGFEIDLSLIAECYANFGHWGWSMMFLLCIFIAKMLHEVDFRDKSIPFSRYVGIVLLYSWFTLPRRKSYYITSNILWYVLVIGGMIIIRKTIGVKRLFGIKRIKDSQ